MIYVNATKYRTVGVSKFKRSFPSLQASAEGTARRPEAGSVPSELAAGKGGVVPQSVAGEDAAASPDINVAQCHGGAERPAGEFSPGKVDLRGREMSAVAYYIRDINQKWRRGVDAFIDVGRLCAEANARLTTADKSDLLPNLLFGEATFSKFVRIGTDIRLQTPEIQRLLPPHYTAMYLVTLLTDEELKQAIAEKVLHPDMTRAQLQKWRSSHREKFVVTPSPSGAASDSAVASLPIAPTQEPSAHPSTMSDDDNRNMQDERVADAKYASAPEAVATAAENKGPLTPPPGDDIPAVLDRRPLSLEDQRAYDAIKATWNSHVLPLWNRTSAVVRERIIAEVIRANPSGHVPGRVTAEVGVRRKSLGPSKVRGSFEDFPF
jgi:hypothetical protein